MVSSIERLHCIQDSQLGPNGVLYREAPLQYVSLYKNKTEVCKHWAIAIYYGKREENMFLPLVGVSVGGVGMAHGDIRDLLSNT